MWGLGPVATYPSPGIVVSTTVGAVWFDFFSSLDEFHTLLGIMRLTTVPAVSSAPALPGSMTPLATFVADPRWFLIRGHCPVPPIPELRGMGHFSSVESNELGLRNVPNHPLFSPDNPWIFTNVYGVRDNGAVFNYDFSGFTHRVGRHQSHTLVTLRG